MDRFGHFVDLEDGRAAIAAFDHSGPAVNSGAVYIFARTRQQWQLETQLIPHDVQNGEQFGASIALDGTTLLVGARSRDLAAANTGMVYVYERTAEGWREAQRLFDPDGRTNDWFGSRVWLDGDDLAFVAAVNGRGGGERSGVVHVFERDTEGWQVRSKLAAADGGSGDAFGSSLATYGRYVVIGARAARGRGSVTGFVRRDSGWSAGVAIGVGDEPEGNYGAQVGFTADGTLMISATHHLQGRVRMVPIDRWRPLIDSGA